MGKEKLEIPFEDNELYYQGLRGVMSSSIYSILGVLIYAILLGKLTYENFSILTLTALFGWVLMCAIIWGMSYLRTNRVFISLSKPKQYPKLAKFFLVLLYIDLGVFCALFYDTFTMLDDPTTIAADFRTSFKSFLITAVVLFVFLQAFSSCAIKKIAPMASRI